MRKTVEKSSVKDPSNTSIKKSGYIDILKVLSEEIRIRLLLLLQDHELMVGEVQEIISVKQSNLSSHLNILRQHGLVSRRREGQKIFYKSSMTGDSPNSDLIKKILETSQNLSLFPEDQIKVKKVIENRKESSLLFFNEKDSHQVTPGQLPEVLLLGFIQLITPATVIDMGCGKGNLSRLLAEAGHTVYGIDHSQKQIKEARQRNSVNHLGETLFQVEDMEKTSFKEGFFDLACLCHSLHHTANPLKALEETHRILKAGGRLLIFDLDHHQDHKMEKKFGDFWMGFRNDELVEWLEGFGFCIKLNRIPTETLYPVRKKIIQPVKPIIVIAEKPL